MTGTLGARLASRDAARFVGRSRELARLEPLLGPDPVASVVFLHGPGGVGKSALMREFARRAVARGWTPLPVDARDVAPLAGAVEAAIAPASGLARPLLLLDSWERLGALDSCLRDNLLPRLPSDVLVVVGSRQPPERGWHEGGWEHIVLEISLGPLDADEADALLESRGVIEPARRAAAASWARGSPLALALAAEADEASVAALADGGSGAMVDRLLSRLLDIRPEGELRSVLAVAALARVTTRELLAQVLPGIDADRAFGWLARHPSAEPLRDGVMLHDLAGQVLRADLRRRAPDLERDLRRRIVDALYAHAVRDGGLLQMTLDLQHLVQDPAIRWGFAWDTSGRYWIGPPRPDDVTAIARLGGRAARAWLEGAEPYFLHAPELVTIVRDRGGDIAGYGVSLTPSTAPAWTADDPVVGPRVAHAARHMPRGAVVICRQAIDLTRRPSSPVTALLGMGSIIGSGLDNPAAAYLPISRTDAAARAFSAACGAQPVAELTIEHGGVRVECHVLDYGPGGLLAFQRAAVYRELGLPPPAVPGCPPVEEVRAALRAYGSRARLAGSLLAGADGSPSAKAEDLRRRIDDAVRDAFGSSRDDRLLRRVLVLGYLDPAPTHEAAAAELNLSRTAYFRHLRAAVERVAAHLEALSSRH